MAGFTRRLPLRWQLALTLAANSLLTALVLGSALAVILGGDYTQAEDRYLQAAGVRAINELGRPGMESAKLAATARSVAISTQTRVKYYGASGRLLADSGSPRGLSPLAAPPSGPASAAPNAAPPAGGPGGPGQNQPGEGPLPNPGGTGIFGGPGTNEPPSSRTLRVDARGSGRQLAAYVVVGEAPASGWSMLLAALQGWLLAAIVALLLAGAIGYAASRRLSRPIMRLTAATDRMAEGDLSARAEETGGDEIGRLSQSFNLMAQRTEASMGALQRFVADAAHELRTPLTALQTDLYMARTEAGTDAERARIAQASRQARRLEGLADSLLRLSRLDAGESVECGPVDLRALISLCANTIASRAEQAGLSLEIDVSDHAPSMITSDAAKLAVAVDNLLDNAVKFTPEGGVVRVGASVDGAHALVWVEDTGIGIPAEDRAEVFGRFSRARNTSAYPGSGLGLAVARAMVELLGGSLGLAETDVGARFEIRLPVG
jgi:signal transduction histidine kinase